MTIGIYSINNLVNGKRYVGKSINIEKRIWAHFNQLKKESPVGYVNRHLFLSVRKHGIANFDWEILESFEIIDDSLIADREVFWMDHHNTTDRDYGYNLMRDSSTKLVVHPETKELLREVALGERNPNYGNFWTDEQKHLMSVIAIGRHESGIYGDEWRAKISKTSKEIWKDEEKKSIMSRKVALATSKYRFYQYDKDTLELVKVWENMQEIMDVHPNYHKKAIYSVSSGYKKSYRGYVWKTEERLVEGVGKFIENNP